MTHRELKRQITDLVSGDELEKAAKLLATYYEGHETSVAVALIAGRLEALNQGLANGLMEFPEYYQARNQLRVGILQLLDGEGLPNKPGLISRYRATLAQAAVLLILIKETEKGLATRPAAEASRPNFSLIIGFSSTSVNVVKAPISTPPSAVSRIPLRESIPVRSTTVVGLLILSLNQSRLSCPPAIAQPFSPASVSRLIALARSVG